MNVLKTEYPCDLKLLLMYFLPSSFHLYKNKFSLEKVECHTN